MTKTLWSLLALVALSCALLLGGAEPAEAKRKCDTLRTSWGQDLVFYRHKMKCGRAKRYARKLIKKGSFDPPNFKCKRHSPTSGGCSHRRKNKFFIFYPEH
jgi:hypothetical protein